MRSGSERRQRHTSQTKKTQSGLKKHGQRVFKSGGALLKEQTVDGQKVYSQLHATEDLAKAGGGTTVSGGISAAAISGTIATGVGADQIINTDSGTVTYAMATESLSIYGDASITTTANDGDNSITLSLGTLDHGGLLGLTDDDHTQYLLVDGTRELSADWDVGGHTLTANGLTIDGIFTDGTMSIAGGNLTNVNYVGASGDADLLQLASDDFTINGDINITGVTTLHGDADPLNTYDVNLGSLAKRYLTLHAAELWVQTLVAQETIATIGGRILVGPTTKLTVDLGDGVGDTTITVEHNQLTQNDVVYLEANGKVEFMTITTVGAPGGGAGAYTYTVTRNEDGSGRNLWYAGDAVFNTGTTGDGFIDMYSVQGVNSNGYGPTIVGNVRNSNIFADWSEHWAIGNLNDIYGYSSNTYGVGLGKYGSDHIVIDATDGIRFRDSGDNVKAQFTSGDLKFFGDTANDYAMMDSSSFDVVLGGSTVARFGSDTRVGEDASDKSAVRLSSGEITLGTNTATAVSIDSSGTATFNGLVNADSFSMGYIIIDNENESDYLVWDGTVSAYALYLDGSQGGEVAQFARLNDIDRTIYKIVQGASGTNIGQCILESGTGKFSYKRTMSVNNCIHHDTGDWAYSYSDTWEANTGTRVHWSKSGNDWKALATNNYSGQGISTGQYAIRWKLFQGTTTTKGNYQSIGHGITNGKQRIVGLIVNIESDNCPSSIPAGSFIAGGGNLQDEADVDREFQTYYDDNNIYIYIDPNADDVQNNSYSAILFFTVYDYV